MRRNERVKLSSKKNFLLFLLASYILFIFPIFNSSLNHWNKKSNFKDLEVNALDGPIYSEDQVPAQLKKILMLKRLE